MYTAEVRELFFFLKALFPMARYFFLKKGGGDKKVVLVILPLLCVRLLKQDLALSDYFKPRVYFEIK